MLECAQSYYNMILAERSWSWSVLAILYIFSGYLIRALFFSPLARQTKKLEHPLGHAVKAAYLRRSLPGWIFFLAPAVLLILRWTGVFVPPFDDCWLIAAGAAGYGLSLLLHLQAFGAGAVVLLKRSSENQKEKNPSEG